VISVLPVYVKAGKVGCLDLFNEERSLTSTSIRLRIITIKNMTKAGQQISKKEHLGYLFQLMKFFRMSALNWRVPDAILN